MAGRETVSDMRRKTKVWYDCTCERCGYRWIHYGDRPPWGGCQLGGHPWKSHDGRDRWHRTYSVYNTLEELEHSRIITQKLQQTIRRLAYREAYWKRQERKAQAGKSKRKLPSAAAEIS